MEEAVSSDGSNALDKLKADLKNHPFQDQFSEDTNVRAGEQTSIRLIAEQAMISDKIDPRDFKQAYDNTKSDDVPEWEHSTSVAVLNKGGRIALLTSRKEEAQEFYKIAEDLQSEQLSEKLEKINFQNLVSADSDVRDAEEKVVDEIAQTILGEHGVKAERLKEAYDSIKPNDVPEWDHSRSASALHKAASVEYLLGNDKESEKLREEIIRVVELKQEKLADELSHEITGHNRTATAAELSLDIDKNTGQDEAELDEIIRNQAARQSAGVQNRDIGGQELKQVPEEFDTRFRIDSKATTDTYYHRDSDTEAFRDKGHKIIVQPESAKLVARDVTVLAHNKGWTDIKVSGSEAFRREVWKEANVRGIDVTGYKPSEQDKRDLNKRLNSIEAAPRDEQTDAENKKIAPRINVDAIGSGGSVNPAVDEQAENRRSTLKESYINKPRSEALGDHPELSGLYKLEGAAKEFAGNSINGEKSQEQFVEAVRERGLDELAKGNQLPELKQQQRHREEEVGR